LSEDDNFLLVFPPETTLSLKAPGTLSLKAPGTLSLLAISPTASCTRSEGAFAIFIRNDCEIPRLEGGVGVQELDLVS